MKPTGCSDTANWRMPGDSFWRESILVDRTCDELKELSTPDLYMTWCDFLSRGIFTDKCAKDACCFCGGGSHAPKSCTDMSGWSLLGGNNIDCSYIEKLDDPGYFCNIMENDSFSLSGLTPGTACCVCGGGMKLTEYPNQSNDASSVLPKFTPTAGRRRTQGSPATPPFAEDPPGPVIVDRRDWTTRSGLGESPGVPNLEFLGIGYHGFLGNPRGSDSSELDPGTYKHIVESEIFHLGTLLSTHLT